VALNPPPFYKLYSADGSGPPPPPPPGDDHDHELRVFSWAMNKVVVDVESMDYRGSAQRYDRT
jgi:hypothetical protein